MNGRWPRRAERIAVDFSEPVVTKQAHKAECDINTIIASYQRTGVVTHLAGQRPVFADLPDVTDYQAALSMIETAERAFADLPSSVRDRYQNDPRSLLSALQSGADDDFLRETGMLAPAPVPRPADPGSPASPAPSPSASSSASP